MFALLILQGLPHWLTFQNALAVLGFVALVGAAIIVLKSRKREENLSQTEKSATAWKETAGAFEKNLTASNLTNKELEEERDTIQSAYTTLSGVIIKELLNDATAWRENRLLKENAALRLRVAELERRLTVHEPL